MTYSLFMSLLMDEMQNMKDQRKPSNYDMEWRTAMILSDLNVAPNHKGFRYLKDAIVMTALDPKSFESVTKTIYLSIANKYDTTVKNVEKNIRFAIKKAFETISPDQLKNIPGFSMLNGKVPSNSRMIAMCAEHVKLYL